jgi:anti-sigma-K factor RskA
LLRAGRATKARTGLISEVELWRLQMATIARVLSLAFPANQVEVETLRTIATICGIGLVVSLLLATNGLDMSAGFF